MDLNSYVVFREFIKKKNFHLHFLQWDLKFLNCAELLNFLTWLLTQKGHWPYIKLLNLNQLEKILLTQNYKNCFNFTFSFTVDLIFLHLILQYRKPIKCLRSRYLFRKIIKIIWKGLHAWFIYHNVCNIFVGTLLGISRLPLIVALWVVLLLISRM